VENVMKVSKKKEKKEVSPYAYLLLFLIPGALFTVIFLAFSDTYTTMAGVKEPEQARFKNRYRDEILDTFLEYNFKKLNPYLLQELKAEGEHWGVAIFITRKDMTVFEDQGSWDYDYLVNNRIIPAPQKEMQLHVRAFETEDRETEFYLSAHYEISRRLPFSHWTGGNSASLGKDLLEIFLAETGWDEYDIS
jgi:hypothetical protein